VKLTVLGCSGSLPGPDSPAAGYLVESDGYRVALDLGNGAVGALLRYVAPRDLDAIVLSHLHADHCLDMTSLMVALRYGPERPRGRIPVIGPEATERRITAAWDPDIADLRLRELFDFARPAPGELGPFQVSFAPMNHPVPTYAVRMTVGGRSLVYSGDTGECGALVTLAAGADTLLAEATFGPREPYLPNLHLTGAQAGQHAARAGVGRLIVTHVPPWGSREVAAAEAAATFGGEVTAAQPGAEFEI
jgi:ribonuclease BN (tRNA processing enzyme)